MNIELSDDELSILQVAFDSWGEEGYFGFERGEKPEYKEIVALFSKLFPGEEINW